HPPHLLVFFFLTLPPPPLSTLFPYTTLFRSIHNVAGCGGKGYRRSGCAGRFSRDRRRATHRRRGCVPHRDHKRTGVGVMRRVKRSEEHTSELQSLAYLVCRLLLEKKKNKHFQ